MTTTHDELIAGFNAYRQAYAHIHTPPAAPPPVPFDRRQIGLALLFILCLTIYAATRTGAVIFETELASGYGRNLAAGLGFVATIGIEGMILFMAITHTRHDQLYDQHHAWILIVGGGIISALAGVSSGFGLLDENGWVVQAVGGLNVALALTLGVGATIMVWASGEFVGTAIHNHRVQSEQRKSQHQQALSAYEARIREAWETSDERGILMHAVEVERARQQAELDILQKQAAHDLRFANTGRDRGVDVLNLHGTPYEKAPASPNGSLNQLDLAYTWLTEHPDRSTWTRLDDLPAAMEIANALSGWYYSRSGETKDFSPGSTNKAREKYVNEFLNGV